MVKVGRWIGLIAAICLLFTSSVSVQAQTPDNEYFAQTGHNVRGDFLRYYKSVENAKILFGYPLTEQFTSRDGKTVQYFQRARFELTSDAFHKVKLTNIGTKTYKPGKQMVINNPLACRTYTQTGYSVCFAFLEFFDRNGGLEQFGYPISPFEYHNDQIVQYFEKGRFEWRPDSSEGQRIGIANLGRIYFDQLREDPGFLKPAPWGYVGPDPKPTPVVLNLQVRAFPARAVTTSSGQQIIYVLVQDQKLQPVAGGNGMAHIHLPDGNSFTQNFTVNEKGVGTLSFDFEHQPNGKLVNIDILVYSNGLQGKTTTSFRIWY